MRTLTIRITPSSDERVVLESLDQELEARGAPSATDSIVLEQAKTIICDFIARARRQYAPGTTIQVSRDFEFSRLRLCVRLDCPGKHGWFERLLNLLRGL